MIVGAGPSGLVLAQIIASEGGDVLIFEEHPKIGLPQHCTGKVSVNAIKELELEATGVLARVSGAIFYPPNLKPLTIEREDTQALILDRSIFDQSLATKAVDAGATLVTNTRVQRFSVRSDGITVFFKRKGKKGEVKARVVAGADGAASSTARLAGLYSKKTSEVRISVQREISDVQTVQSKVELYFGRRWAPGFFAWIVPTGHDTARIGLALQPNTLTPVVEHLDNFMKYHPIAREKLVGCRVLAQSRHIIPTGGVLRRTVSDGVLILGDAAGQVKSTTGGGLYYGMACAKIAGRAIVKALHDSPEAILREKALKSYETEWRDQFGGEIAFSVRFRAFLDSLSDDEFNYLFNVIQRDASLIKRIEVDGDIDHQSKVGVTLLRYVKYMIKKPGLIFKLRRVFPRPSLT
ncbi:MAG: NAD(P)/FAD-dependent oxidoreductase [Candidatus Bathyarchaeia archaeon]